MPLLRTSPLVQLLFHTDTASHFRQSSIDKTFSSLPVIYSFILCRISLSHPRSAATCNPRYLKSTFSYGFPFIRITFTYRVLLLRTFTHHFLLSHTLPNSLTILHNFSESAASAVSSANNSCFSRTCHHPHIAVPTLSQAP